MDTAVDCVLTRWNKWFNSMRSGEYHIQVHESSYRFCTNQTLRSHENSHCYNDNEVCLLIATAVRLRGLRMDLWNFSAMNEWIRCTIHWNEKYFFSEIGTDSAIHCAYSSNDVKLLLIFLCKQDVWARRAHSSFIIIIEHWKFSGNLQSFAFVAKMYRKECANGIAGPTNTWLRFSHCLRLPRPTPMVNEFGLEVLLIKFSSVSLWVDVLCAVGSLQDAASSFIYVVTSVGAADGISSILRFQAKIQITFYFVRTLHVAPRQWVR